MRTSPALIAGLLLSRLAFAAPVDWPIDTSRSSIFVDVKKKGALSGLAHDHHFRVERWTCSVSMDSTRPESLSIRVVAQAESLRDEAPGLSASDRDEVNARAAGPKVLDAQRFPTITLEARGRPVEGAGTFVLVSRFSLHGATNELEVPVQWDPNDREVSAKARFSIHQSDYGIVPYSAALGTIGVKDEVEIRVELVARRP